MLCIGHGRGSRSETDEGSVSADASPSSGATRRLLPQGEKGNEHRFGFAYWVLTRARQRDSKLSSSIIRACASMGPLRFSVATLTGGATLTLACAGAAGAHRNKDFEIMVLPAYQHFRPSIWRQDQCPCVFDGEALHSLICALACAVSMPIGASAAMQTAKKKSRVCVFIDHSPCG